MAGFRFVDKIFFRLFCFENRGVFCDIDFNYLNLNKL